MNGKEMKACIFAGFLVIVYAIHQITVGGDGIIMASVVGAIAAIGGYAYRGKEL